MGRLASTVTDPVIKALMQIFSLAIANAEFTPGYGFLSFHTFYVSEEPFTDLAVEEGSSGSRMNSCPMYFSFLQFYVQRIPGVE